VDLNRVAIFSRVVAEGSFTAAARALGLPKSSVSRSVALLEHDLGVRLLQRSTRALRLTDAGARLHDKASRALADLDEATAEASDREASASGVVRVTAPVDLGVAVLAPVVARFSRAHPSIRVELVLTARVVDLVGEGVDLALRVGVVQGAALVARLVAKIESGLYASRGYLAASGAPGKVEELGSHACVLFRGAHGAATWALSGPSGVRRVRVAGRLDVDDLSAARKCVLAGAGIGLLPAILVAREVERGRLVRVLPEHSAEATPLHLAVPTARLLPKRVALLRDLLLSELPRLRWSCS
jgi:DNA-binding transcriptional LysR family regulator